MCQVPLPASHDFGVFGPPSSVIGSSQDGSHLYLPQHLAGFIAVEESLLRKVRENMTQKGRNLCNKNIDMDGSSQGLGRCGRLLKCSDDLRIWRLWKFAAAQNTDICDLDLENPRTKMESVVLPEETKTLISKTVQSLSLFKKLGTSAWLAQLITAVIQTCMAHPEPYGAKEEQAPV